MVNIMGIINGIVVEIALSCIGVVLTYLFIQVFLKEKSKIYSGWRNLVLFIVLTANFMTNQIYSEYIVVILIVSFLSAFLIGTVCFKAKIHGVGIASFFQLIADGISQIMAILIMTGFQKIFIEEAMQFNIFRFLVQLVNYLVYLMFILSINRFKNIWIDIMASKLMLSFCMLSTISVLIVQQFVVHSLDTTNILEISGIMPIFSIIIVSIFAFILSESMLRQNEKNRALVHIEAHSKTQQLYIEHLILNYDHIRKMSHDFKHQVVLLHALCKERYYDELLTALHQISNYTPEPVVINTENIMLDTVLSSKKEEARRRDIKMDIKLDVIKNITYIDLDYCVMLSNALDNAMEACDRSIGKIKLIELELTLTMSFFMLRIRNTLGETPESNGEFLKSKKADQLRHGIGLKSIKQTCNKLGGDMVYEFNDEYFMLWIYIQL